jgi:hypothetical protein
MEPFIIAITRVIEAVFVEGATGIGAALKAIGAMGLVEWMWDHPQITLGALAAGLYFTVTNAGK